MRIMLKFEFDRLLRSKTFYLSFFLALIIVNIPFFTDTIPLAKNILRDYSSLGNGYPYTAFEGYIGLSSNIIIRNLYNKLIPILSIVAYAHTFGIDNSTGYIKNIYTRIDKKKYYFAKLVVSSFAGGVVTVVPYMVNMLLNAMILPSLSPQPSLQSFPSGPGMFSDLLFSHPYFYVLIYWVIMYLFQMIFCLISLLLGRFIRNPFLVSIFPFVLTYFTNMILAYLHISKYSFENIIMAVRVKGKSLDYILVEWLVIVGVLMVLYFMCSRKDESL